MAKSRIGVCSWSLQPRSVVELAAKVEATGLKAVQLALDPIRRAQMGGETGGWDEAETVAVLGAAGIEILSGMMAMAGEDYTTLESIRRTGGVRPDAPWAANLKAARENAELAARLGLDLVTFHAGFIPPEGGRAREVMIARLRAVVDCFEACGVGVGFETGQETAGTLLAALAELERPNVGVNFDPANMILYGMGDPVVALRELAERVVQVHIKDALPTAKAGTWGSEEIAGRGAVDWRGFFAVVRDCGLEVDLVIEREAGENRIAEVRAAVGLLKSLGCEGFS